MQYNCVHEDHMTFMVVKRTKGCVWVCACVCACVCLQTKVVCHVTCSTNSCNGTTEVCVYSSDVISTIFNMASYNIYLYKAFVSNTLSFIAARQLGQ